MGKRKNVIAPNDERAVAAMDKQQKEIEKAEELYGDGLPFDQFRLETGIKSRNAAVAATMIQNGRDFLRLKAHLPHGEFITSVERTSGKPRFWAYHCMRAAEMFLNVAQDNISGLNFSQIRTLSLLEKPVVEEYLKGGPLGDIPHDDVATMPRDELEAEARKLKKKLKEAADSREAVIQEKEKKINEMDRRLRGQEPPTKEQLAALKLEEHLKPFNTQLQDAIFAMNRCAEMITEIQRIENIGYVQLNAWVLKQSEDIENFTESFTELQDALNDIHIDRGDTEGGEDLPEGGL
jgi:hypothetical protein